MITKHQKDAKSFGIDHKSIHGMAQYYREVDHLGKCKIMYCSKENMYCLLYEFGRGAFFYVAKKKKHLKYVGSITKDWSKAIKYRDYV